MLVAARPILTSENEGASRGTLIMGRFLNDDLVKTLEDQSKVVFSIHPAGLNPSLEQGTEIPGNGTSGNTYRLEKQGPSHLLVSTTLSDVEGNPVLLITANIPRTISAKGYDTIRYALISGFVSMLLALIIMLFVLQGTILRHISKLTNHALSIRRTGDLSTRLSVHRRDEIGALAVEFDKMVEKLEKQTDKLTELNAELKKDISRRIQVEEALRESEEKLFRSKKMEAMGLMAGGVAHDLNNILSGIVSYPELLLMNLPEDSPLRKPLKTIQESGMRAADVVEDLMTIARGVASSKEVLNLNTVVEEYQKSVEHQKLERTHSSLNFKTELDPELLNMNGSLIHIRKILMNLVANASEAINGSGTVTISTMNQYLDQPLKGYEEVRMGEYVVLAVSDDGSGVSPEDLERIFEPFYTKKVMGLSGTGLGLAVVWNTVQDHNGYINVRSNDKGTEFELYFPVTREEVTVDKEAVPLDDYMGNGETILVVDDEERQREIASGMLSNLGYNVEAVSSGEEAVEYVKEHPVNLIVLDMVMPKGINGRETYEEIIKIRRGQKAIIASGYAKTKEVDTARALGAGKYIKKPYTLEKIGVAVKEELEK